MSILQYPLINGVRHDFSSIELKIAGLIFTGFRSINYSRTRTRAMPRGNSPDPLGKTRGENAYKCDFELYLAEWNLLQAALIVEGAAQLGLGWGDVPFIISVTYTETGFDSLSDTILGNTLDTVEASQSQSPDALVRKCETNPLKILYNGIDDLGLISLVSPPGL